MENVIVEYIKIYFGNLSLFYGFSWIFTVVALFSTWWLRSGKPNSTCCLPVEDRFSSNQSQKESEGKVKTGMQNTLKEKALPGLLLENRDAERTAAEQFAADQNLLRRFKTARQQAIEDQLTAGLSDDQLANEQEVQANQLAAIFNLLKQQEDQFKIKSMDELQEQMKLYKA